jgi:hypothetical protein
MKSEPQTAKTVLSSDETKTARTVFRSDAMQRIMAFGALIVLAIGFSLASPFFRTFDNFVGILLATAVNGVLGLGVTFVIITAGIDLSVGTVMTFSAVMTGALQLALAHPPRDSWRRWGGSITGVRQCHLAHENHRSLPPWACMRGTLSGDLKLKPIYFNDTPAFREMSMVLCRQIIPDLSAECCLHHVWSGNHCSPDFVPHDPGALHLCHRQQRGSHAPLGCQCRRLEDSGLYPVRIVQRDCWRVDRFASEFGSTCPGVRL